MLLGIYLNLFYICNFFEDIHLLKFLFLQLAVVNPFHRFPAFWNGLCPRFYLDYFLFYTWSQTFLQIDTVFFFSSSKGSGVVSKKTLIYTSYSRFSFVSCKAVL